jgi:hypothetical protein
VTIVLTPVFNAMSARRAPVDETVAADYSAWESCSDTADPTGKSRADLSGIAGRCARDLVITADTDTRHTRLDLTGLADWLVERGLRGLPLDEHVTGSPMPGSPRAASTFP